MGGFLGVGAVRSGQQTRLPALGPSLASWKLDPRRRLGVVDPADKLLIGLTAGRLLLVLPVIVLLAVSPLATGVLLTVFVGVDILDGLVGRRRGTDGPGRRALDSAVDRVSIHAVYLAVSLHGLLPPWMYAVLVVRDLYCAWICSRMMRERWTAIRADWMYRTFNVALATWVVIAPLVGPGARSTFMAFVIAWGVVVAFDLRRSVEQVRGASADNVGVVVSATTLRKARRLSGA